MLGGNICAQLLPLHYACLLQPSVGVIKALIAAHGKALQCKDHSGRLSLHCACWRAASPDVDKVLLDNGSCCMAEDKHGRLPLHVACEFGAEVELVRLLVRALPDAIVVRDHLNRTPLTVTAHSHFYNKNQVMQVLEGGFWSASKSFEHDENDNNDATLEVEEDGPAINVNTNIINNNTSSSSSSPSLFALISHKQWKQVDARVNTTTDSNISMEVRRWVEKRDAKKVLIWKLLPIHRLCEMQPQLEVVRAIVHAYPISLTLPDHRGRLPLHSACRKGASHDVIDLLVQVEPRTALCKDKKERLPLHIAVEYNASKLVIEVLLRVAAGGAEIPDKRGRLPLHLAAKHGAGEQVIFQIFWAYRAAVLKEDNDGHTPLWYARKWYRVTESTASKQAVETLLGFLKEYFPNQFANYNRCNSNVKTSPAAVAHHKAMKLDELRSFNTEQEIGKLPSWLPSLNTSSHNIDLDDAREDNEDGVSTTERGSESDVMREVIGSRYKV